MGKKLTIKDIADECGVSLSTVSLVLNDNPRISDATRRKVLQVVQKHGYQPNAHARGLASRSSKTLSVIVPELPHVFADVYFGEIISGVYDYAQENGYKVLLDVATPQFIQKEEYLNLLRGKRADGMLYVASRLSDEFLKVFINETFPFLLVNHYFKELPLNFVATDYKQTAQIAAEHFLDLNHKKFAVIQGNFVQTSKDLVDTFHRQLASHGISPDAVYVVEQDFSERGGYEAAHNILYNHPDVTAILAGNDRMAIGCLRYLSSIGKKCPEDISVMGVDDINLASYTTPTLTTVKHDLYRIGRLSAARLVSLIKEEIKSCQEMLPVNLVKRESTGPAPTP